MVKWQENPFIYSSTTIIHRYFIYYLRRLRQGSYVSALYVCLSSRSYQTNFGEFFGWVRWCDYHHLIGFDGRSADDADSGVRYFKKYHCGIETIMLRILLITVDEILRVFERWDVPIAKYYLILVLSRIQQLLTECLSSKNGHCKNFEISAALAVVCGFRVYQVYLIFTCGGVYAIRR